MKKACVLPLVLCLQCLNVQAAGPYGPEAATLNILVENDGFILTDRHYTSGLEISYLSPPRSAESIASRVAKALPGNRAGEVRVGWHFGQMFFTPKDTAVRALIPDQRPYAAWLYGGVSLVRSGPGHVDTWTLLLGTVGPHAFAEPLQDEVHEWLGLDESRGWGNQIGNRIGGSLVVGRTWRVSPITPASRVGIDLLPHFGLSIGNIETYANTGFIIRIGEDLGSDFGPPHIRPGVPGSGWFEPLSQRAWYVFAGVDGRYVERNIFLDDNDLASLLDIDKKRWVTDLQAGFVLTRGDFRLACTLVHRSKEYAQQSEPDRFGSVGFTWRF